MPWEISEPEFPTLCSMEYLTSILEVKFVLGEKIWSGHIWQWNARWIFLLAIHGTQ